MGIGSSWGRSHSVDVLLFVGLSLCGVVIFGVFVSPGRLVVVFVGVFF